MASSEQTTKRHLNKPQPEDFVNVINDICDNMDNLDDAVPDSRKVNGHALNGDITVSKSDVGLGNVDNVQQVPATRKVNNKALSSDINLQGTDIQVSSSDSRKVDAAIANCDSETASLKSAFSVEHDTRNKAIEIKNNYFDKNVVVNGKFYNGSLGGTATLTTATDYWCALVPVTPGQSYRIARRDYNLYEVDENLTILAIVTGNTDVDFVYTVKNSNTKYITVDVNRYSTQPRYTPDTFIITDQVDTIDGYVNYPYEVKYNKDELKRNDVVLSDVFFHVYSTTRTQKE